MKETLGQKMLGGGGFVVVRCSSQFRFLLVVWLLVIFSSFLWSDSLLFDFLV